MNELTVTIGSVSYKGFQSIDIVRTMRAMSGSFLVRTANFFGGPTSWKIAPGDPVKLKIDKKLILSGYLDSFTFGGNKDSRWVIWGGRDSTGQLVDCSYSKEPNEWKKQSVGQLIRFLVSPFGISVNIDASASVINSKMLDSFKANEGDTVADLIIRLCYDHGVLPMTLGDGRLHITRAATVGTKEQLKDNIISREARLTNIDRFSEYSVKGYGIGSSMKSLNDWIGISGQYSDPGVSLYRPRILFQDTPTDKAKLQDKAVWEANLRAGFSRALVYKTSEWVMSDGVPWIPNMRLLVDDPMINLKRELLICDVRYLYNADDGYETELTLVDPNTFSLNRTKIDLKDS